MADITPEQIAEIRERIERGFASVEDSANMRRLLRAFDAAEARADAAEIFKVACQEGAEIVGELNGRVAELEAKLREATEQPRRQQG